MKNKEKLCLVKQASSIAIPAGVTGLGGAALGGLIGSFTDQGALRGAGIGGLTGLGLGAGAVLGGGGGMNLGQKLADPQNLEELLKRDPNASVEAMQLAGGLDAADELSHAIAGGLAGTSLGAGGGSLAGYLAGKELFGKKKKEKRKKRYE